MHIATQNLMKGEDKTMARIPVVSRTINTTKCLTMMVNKETGATSEEIIILPRTYKTADEALKVAVKMYADKPLKPVFIKSMENEAVRYGMLETDFISDEKTMILPLLKSAEEEE